MAKQFPGRGRTGFLIPRVAGGYFGITSGLVEDAGIVLVDNASHFFHIVVVLLALSLGSSN